MLDIKFIRENADLIKEAARKKRVDFDVSALIAVDDKRKGLLAEVESLRAEQNRASDEIAKIQDAKEREEKIESMKSVKIAFQTKDEELKKVMQEWRALMVRVPNVPDVSVPEGEDDTANVEIKSWGEKKKFDFAVKNSIDLLQQNDMVDFERGAKVAGFRGYFLKGDGVLLNFAIWQFALKFFSERGFKPVMSPALVRPEALIGTGYLPQGAEDLYKTQDDLYLAGTAEVGLMSMYSDEVLPKESLPIKYLGFSECFRREAGAHGKNTKGFYRVHEFFKFEQLVFCEADHEVSVQLHEEVTKNSEEFLQALGIPYRVVLNCGGDIGLGQVKKYDIESWIYSEDKYGETHSASYFHDFQTRRLNICYKDSQGKQRYAHSLNNTAAATPRLLISILEHYQQADGTIAVPDVLVPYVGKKILGGKL